MTAVLEVSATQLPPLWPTTRSNSIRAWPAQTIDLTSGELRINKSLDIVGFSAKPVVIDGNDTFRVFTINNGVSVDLSGLEIAHGAIWDGGGIYNYGTLSITDCTVSKCSAALGGGIYNSGLLTITDSTISRNSVRVDGGGIYNRGSLMITGSTIWGNSYGQDGYGGGIYNRGSLMITGSTIWGNSCEQHGYGGGICSSGSLTIAGSTIAGNSATLGGGVCLWGPATLNNSIVADNTCSGSPDIYGEVTAQYCLIESNTGVSISGTGNIIGQDPLLSTLGYYGGPTQTIPLLSGSPAINAGSNALIPSGVTEDQRGEARISGGTVDIGAYESQPLTLTVDTAVDENDGDYAPGDLSLREAVGLANTFSNTTITFASSLSGSTITLIATLGQLNLTNTTGTTAIVGLGADELIISGNNACRIFNIASGVTANISGLEITNGKASNGAGVFNCGTLSVTDCAISKNSSSGYNGGGIYHTGGSLVITGSTISENSAYSGGGIFMRGWFAGDYRQHNQ